MRHHVAVDAQWDEVGVFAAARVRAVALVTGDQDTLRNLLHPEFQWTGDDGVQMDRDSYVETFTSGDLRWRHQRLLDPEVVVVGDTAVLFCTVDHDLEGPQGRDCFRRRMSQTWVRDRDQWRCLAAHAGHRLT